MRKTRINTLYAEEKFHKTIIFQKKAKKEKKTI